jgi:hypothetical protein
VKITYFFNSINKNAYTSHTLKEHLLLENIYDREEE